MNRTFPLTVAIVCVGVCSLLNGRAIVIDVPNYLVINSESRIYDVVDGQTWEYSNDLLPGGGFTSDTYRLSVGDTLRINTTLTSTVLLFDSSNRDELFRSFHLRFPDGPGLDVSSIKTRISVTFYDPGQASIGTFNSPESRGSWPYVHYGGEMQTEGLQNVISSDFVNAGGSIEIAGWQFELSILDDPQGLLSQSIFPWVSFGFKADQIRLGASTLPPAHAVPDSGSTMIMLSAGLIGLAFHSRRFASERS